MKYDNFDLQAYPVIQNAVCRKCHNKLIEVSNGWFSKAMFCPKCESVYALKLIKVPDKKVSKAFVEQAINEYNKSINHNKK